MKITKCITVDAEAWAKAKQRTDNVSGTINFLLNRWIETEAEEYERNKIDTLKHELERQRAEFAVLQKQLQDQVNKNKKTDVIKVIE